MKKLIAVLLSVIFVFSAVSVGACAISENQTYYISYDLSDDCIKIIPEPGYSRYVFPGEDFKFTIQVDEGYSDTFILAQVNYEDIEPDENGVYTIPEVNEDTTLYVFLSMEEEQSNMFASLIVFVHDILEWFKNLFESLFGSLGI